MPDILEKSSFPQSKVNHVRDCSCPNLDHRATVYRSSNSRETDPDKVEKSPGGPAARSVDHLKLYICIGSALSSYRYS